MDVASRVQWFARNKGEAIDLAKLGSHEPPFQIFIASKGPNNICQAWQPHIRKVDKLEDIMRSKSFKSDFFSGKLMKFTWNFHDDYIMKVNFHYASNGLTKLIR